MSGAPVFRGTRVPVQTMFDYLGAGESLETFLDGFPTVSRDDALEVLHEAAEMIASGHGSSLP